MDRETRKRWQEDIRGLDAAGYTEVKVMLLDRGREILRERRAELQAEIEWIDQQLEENAPAENTPTTQKLKPKPKATARKQKSEASSSEAIITVLQDEGGPLTASEIAERLGPVAGYPVEGLDRKTIKNRVGAAVQLLKKHGKIINEGKGIGWTLAA